MSEKKSVGLGQYFLRALKEILLANLIMGGTIVLILLGAGVVVYFYGQDSTALTIYFLIALIPALVGFLMAATMPSEILRGKSTRKKLHTTHENSTDLPPPKL